MEQIPEVPAQHLAREQVAGPGVALRARGGVLEHVVRAVHQHRHPADAAFGQRDVEAGETERHAGPQPFARRQQRVHGEEGRQELEGRVGRGERGPGRGTRVQTDDGVGLLAGREEGVPRAAEDRRELQLRRELGEAHRLEPACRVGPDLAGRHRHVGEPRQLQRDDALGPVGRPHLQVPVVEGPEAGQAEVLVLRTRVDGTAEARDERGKAERGPQPGPVHVLDAGGDVEAAQAHLVEASRVHAPLLAGPAHYGVEPDVRVAIPLEDPGLRPVCLFDHAGCAVLERGRQAPLEEVGRLDQVVVDGDHRHTDGPRLGVGQQGGPVAPCLPAPSRRLP